MVPHEIKARDDQARRYQIEIQLLTYADLLGRILYTWNDLYNLKALLKADNPPAGS